MSLTKNPIELLMSLGVDSTKSKSNIDLHISALKKYYDRNPLLISLGINKGRLQTELNEISGIINKKQNELKVNVNSGEALKGMKELESQINKVITKLSEMNNKIKSTSTSGVSSNVGNVATSSLASSIAQLQALNNGTVQSASQFRNLQTAINNTGSSLNTVANNANNATRSTNALSNAFQQAFTKFPIWINILMSSINSSNSVETLLG